MEDIPRSKPICGKPTNSFFVNKDRYLRLQTHKINDITPPISENESLLIIITNGSGSIIINGVEFNLKTNTFIWLQSYHTFTIKCNSYEPLEFKLFVYDYPLSSFLAFKEPSHNAIDTIVDAIPIIYLDDKYSERVNDLIDEFSEFDEIFTPGASLIKVSILGELAKIFIDISIKNHSSNNVSSPKPLAWKAILYMSKFFYKDLTADSVAKIFNTTATILNRDLRNVSGYNFIQNLNRIRVNIASSALLYEDLSLSYIALHSGFSSEVVFYRIFKQYMHTTPIEYRNKLITQNNNSVYRGMIMSSCLMQILNYTYDNFSSPIDLKIVSKDLFLSENTIRNIIHEKFKSSYKSIILFNRIRHAEALLLTTDLTILDIAINVGFNCDRSFSRAFKKICNMTPSEYRKLHCEVKQDE